MQYFKGTNAELADLLRQGAADLTPYSLDEVASPDLNAALPAFLNEAANRLTDPTPPRPDREGLREGFMELVEEASYWRQYADGSDVEDTRELVTRLQTMLCQFWDLLPLPPVPSEEQVEVKLRGIRGRVALASWPMFSA